MVLNQKIFAEGESLNADDRFELLFPHTIHIFLKV